MTIRIPTKNWQRAKPNASAKIQVIKRKKKRFVSPSRAASTPTAKTPSKSPTK